MSVCVCRKYHYGQLNKNICSSVCVCVCVCVGMLVKSIESMCPLLVEVKGIKIDFTYIYVYVCVYINDGPFFFFS